MVQYVRNECTVVSRLGCVSRSIFQTSLIHPFFCSISVFSLSHHSSFVYFVSVPRLILNKCLPVIHWQWDSTRDAAFPLLLLFLPRRLSPPPFLSLHHVIRYLVIRWIPRGWYVPRQTRETFLFSFIYLSLPPSIPPSCVSNRLLSHMRFSRRVADLETELMLCFNGSCLNHIHHHLLKHTLGYSHAQSSEAPTHWAIAE